MLKKLISMVLVGAVSTSLLVGCSGVKDAAKQGFEDGKASVTQEQLGDDAKDLSTMLTEYGNDVTENSHDLDKIKSISSEYKTKVSKYVDKYSNIEDKTEEQQKLYECFTQFENTLILMEQGDIQGATVQLKGLTETCNELTEMYR